jgi:hypothetical protein
MDMLNRMLIRHPGIRRAAWLVVVLALAACNNGDAGDGGGEGY